MSIHLPFATHIVLQSRPWWLPSVTGWLTLLGWPVHLPPIHGPGWLPSPLSATPPGIWYWKPLDAAAKLSKRAALDPWEPAGTARPFPRQAYFECLPNAGHWKDRDG